MMVALRNEVEDTQPDMLREYKRLLTKKGLHYSPEQAVLLEQLAGFANTIGQNFGIASLVKRKLAGRASSIRQGFYIHGDVGRGKSMLMDIFFKFVEARGKERVHFNRFMQLFHSRMHELKTNNHTDPVQIIIRETASRCRLLCLDEMQINDVAEALILRRLFCGLLERGVFIVLTSNRPPEDLYRDVFQREKFQELVKLLRNNFHIAHLETGRDFRRSRLNALSRTYFYPLGLEAENFAEETWRILTNGGQVQEDSLEVNSRRFLIPGCYMDAARFNFSELCGKAHAAADYAALAKRFKILLLTDIPRLTTQLNNEAKRFIILIDELYEHKTRLIATAAAAPDDLYNGEKLNLEFPRTASRLIEMQSEDYLNGD